MPRGSRLDAPGVLHHVMVRGIECRNIFRTDSDRRDLVARLASLAEAGALHVYAWALLPNHAHFLVRTGSRPLARSMRSLLTGYAGAFNRRHKRAGHLFKNRYKSVVVEEESYLLELVRYIHLNPLRVGVASDVRSLERYPWAGHAAICGRTSHPWQATDDILGRFARHRRKARVAYRDFVASGVSQGRRPDLQGGGLVRGVDGWQAVQELRRGREAYVADERILGGSDFVEEILRDAEERAAAEKRRQRRPLELTTLVQRVGKSLGLSPEAISGRNRLRKALQGRHLVAYLWVERLGRTASELARSWGWSRGQVTWAAKRGERVARVWEHEVEEWCG